jgi:transcriptional regulator with XRE-family HTH domain
VTVGEKFGENLRRCRRRVRLSQEQTAARASLHRTEIGFIEQGKRKPRIDTLVKLAAAVEAPVGELLAGIEWIPRNQKGGDFYVSPPWGSRGTSEYPTSDSQREKGLIPVARRAFS